MIYDIAIIGKGPAGLVCGQYAARGGMNTIIIDDVFTGSQANSISIVENYPGLEPISGCELIRKFESQAIEFGCDITNEKVEKIEKKDDSLFVITTSEDEIVAHAVVIATGTKRNKLGVKGEEELEYCGVSYCATCDGPFFKDKKILVVGGGDSACQETLHLLNYSKDITVCIRGEKLRAQNAIAEKLKESGVKIRTNTTVESINGTKKVESVTLKTNENISIENFDAVFIFAGVTPNTDILPKGCRTNADGYIITDGYMETSVHGIFAAGDVRYNPTGLKQIVIAASDGALAAFVAIDHVKHYRRENEN